MSIEIIGRDAELSRLGELAARARTGGGSGVLVTGEAGVGKTALARAALQASGLRFLEAAAEEGGGPPYAPLAAILRSGMRATGFTPDLRDPARRCLAVLLPELGAPPPEEARQPQLVFEAVGQALSALAAAGPLGILVDDVQWADAGTLDALAFLAGALSRLPVLAVVAYRNDGVARAHPVRRLRRELRRQGSRLEFALQPLGSGDASRLVEARLGARPSPDLARQLYERSEGLPFFLEEVTAALGEAGSLRRGPRGLELDPASALPLPESVREAVLQRFERLPADLREVLSVAAASGRELDLLLADGSQADDLLTRLPATGMMVESAPGRLAFAHALVREAVYEAIPWGRRRTLHRELALRLEASARPEPEAVAGHWIAAGEGERARRWLLQAARQAHAACAYRDAVRQLNRALELWPLAGEGEGEARVDALELLARCADLAGTPGVGVRALTELVEILEQRGEAGALGLAEAERHLAALLEVQGAWERALTAHQLAAEAYAAAGLPGEAAAERLASAAKLRSAASFTAALDLVEVGKGEAAAAGRADLRLRLLALEGNVRARAGDSERGIAIVRVALSEALALSDFASAAEVYQRLADSLEHTGDYGAARSTYLEAAAFCRTNGAAGVGDVCLACLTMVLRQTGQWEQALAVCRDVLGSPDATAHALAVAHGVGGSILLHRGRLREARSELHNSNVIARRIGLAAMEIDSEAHLARLAQSEGRREEALERAWRTLRRWQRTDGERHYSIHSLAWIAGFAGETGAPELLRACTVALTAVARRPDPEVQAATSLALAEGQLAEGDAAGAAPRFEQAVALLAELDLPYERARAEWRAAVALARAGDRSAAMPRFRAAYRALIHLGARPQAGRLAEEVAALGEKVERRLGRLAASGVGHGGLSPRELEVTRLVADGLTTREVAARLTLSPRTVEMHIHRILHKLDCRTRVDITRRAAELGLLGAGRDLRELSRR